LNRVLLLPLDLAGREACKEEEKEDSRVSQAGEKDPCPTSPVKEMP
jgi:hypothetical protein